MLCQSVDLEFLADGSLDNLFHSVLAMTAEFARMAVVRERHSSTGKSASEQYCTGSMEEIEKICPMFSNEKLESESFKTDGS